MEQSTETPTDRKKSLEEKKKFIGLLAQKFLSGKKCFIVMTSIIMLSISMSDRLAFLSHFIFDSLRPANMVRACILWNTQVLEPIFKIDHKSTSVGISNYFGHYKLYHRQHTSCPHSSINAWRINISTDADSHRLLHIQLFRSIWPAHW